MPTKKIKFPIEIREPAASIHAQITRIRLKNKDIFGISFRLGQTYILEHDPQNGFSCTSHGYVPSDLFAVIVARIREEFQLGVSP